MSSGEFEVTGCDNMDHDIRNSSQCERISEMLSRVGDKWTILIIRRLGAKSQRFNALRREIGDISQKMLSTTLRNLERDGFVIRTVTPTNPPQVEYTLTCLGHELLVPVQALANWTYLNMDKIEQARVAYNERNSLSEAA